MTSLVVLLALLPACASDDPPEELPCGQAVAVTPLSADVIGTRAWFEDGGGNGVFTSWRAEVVDEAACGFDRRVDVFAMTVAGPLASFRLKADGSAASVLNFSEGTLEVGLVDGQVAGRFRVRKTGSEAGGVFLADAREYLSCATRQWPADATADLEDRLTAAGKRLVDCRDADPALAAGCIEAAQAAGDGFVAHWAVDDLRSRAYLGEPVADGYRVWQSDNARGAEPADAETHTLAECQSFSRLETCSTDDGCFACPPVAAPPTTLCQEAE